MKFTKKRYLTEHIKVKHENFRYECKSCDKNYSCPTNLKLHVEENHPIGPIIMHKCDLCPNEYKRLSRLTNHKKEIHDNNSPIECKICGKRLSTKGSFHCHIRRVHKIKFSEYRHNRFTNETQVIEAT